jgi:Lrp/AsnC family transcriptional regulator, leucine-responsive regulatory protein
MALLLGGPRIRRGHGTDRHPAIMVQLDSTDLEILRLLQTNARMSNAEIARQVRLAPSAIFQRIRKLEDRGVVKGYASRLNARALGYGLVAFVMVQTRSGAGEHDTGGLLAALPAVQEVHRVVGEDCFIIKVRVHDTAELGELLEHQVQKIPTIASTRTTIVVRTLKETADLPLAGDETVGGDAIEDTARAG